MGIRGLLKYIRSDLSTVKLESVMLFKRSDEKQILVCDLVAVFYWLIALLHNAKVTCKDYSQYTCIYGGNFKDYKERLLEFVQALRFINVEPVFFWDGPQGSGLDYKHKVETWKYRSRKLLKKILKNAEICNFHWHAIEIKYEKRLKQTLLFEELVQTLRDASVTVNLCEGEADNVMAQYAREHKEVCTILTNDTDIALMSGVSMVHYKFFDRKDVLELSRPTLKCRSHEICCDIMKPLHLAKEFKIDEKCLPALSILCGNDFTKSLNETVQINELLGFSHPYVVSVSVWIKHHENDCKSADSFLSIKQIQEICEKDSSYLEAVEHSYNFYQEECISFLRNGFPASPIHDFIAEKVRKYQMDRQFLALVRNGVLWRFEIEQPDERFPCIHEKLQPVHEIPPKLAARPGPTGVTIGAQFMVILRHARWLASLLGLEELLPLPSSIFQPFIYIPLHGTAFKIHQKENFYNDDQLILKYYNDLLENKNFIEFRDCLTTIVSNRLDGCFTEVVDKYVSTCKVLIHDREFSATTQKLKKKK